MFFFLLSQSFASDVILWEIKRCLFIVGRSPANIDVERGFYDLLIVGYVILGFIRFGSFHVFWLTLKFKYSVTKFFTGWIFFLQIPRLLWAIFGVKLILALCTVCDKNELKCKQRIAQFIGIFLSFSHNFSENRPLLNSLTSPV